MSCRKNIRSILSCMSCRRRRTTVTICNISATFYITIYINSFRSTWLTSIICTVNTYSASDYTSSILTFRSGLSRWLLFMVIKLSWKIFVSFIKKKCSTIGIITANFSLRTTFSAMSKLSMFVSLW